MKKKTKKALALALCAVMLVAGTALTTIAYLTSKDSVTNTFTVGEVHIKLDEAIVDEYGVPKTVDNDTRTSESNEYKLVPGVTYVKDPTVYVQNGSEECYVRMLVTVSNIEKLKAAIPQNDKEGKPIAANAKFYGENGLFLLQELCVDENGNNTWDPTKWTVAGYKNVDDKGIYEFHYHTTVDFSEVDGDEYDDLEPLFEKFTIPKTVTEEQLPNLNNITLNVEAHAIQAAGFKNNGGATAAWTAFDQQNAE